MISNESFVPDIEVALPGSRSLPERGDCETFYLTAHLVPVRINTHNHAK